MKPAPYRPSYRPPPTPPINFWMVFLVVAMILFAGYFIIQEAGLVSTAKALALLFVLRAIF